MIPKKNELMDLEDDKEEYKGHEISNELRETISTIAVMQSCSTDIGQTITITGSLLTWVMAGLYSKYGYQLMGLDKQTAFIITEIYDEHDNLVNPDNIRTRWEYAIDLYNTSRSYWGNALKICNVIATQLISVCVVHDMLDYSMISQSVTQRMQTMNLEDDEPDPTKRGYGKKIHED